jgi:electron transfer flavoprotein beta subunit
MKIFVPFRRVIDPASLAGVDGSQRAVWIINPFDGNAIEEAVRFKERREATELVGVTIGSVSAQEQIRTALAMGLDRVIRVAEFEGLDSLGWAQVLAAVVRRESPTLVLMGKQSADEDPSQVGPMLAALLGWPQVTSVSKMESLRATHEFRCVREADHATEVVDVKFPAVVTVDLRLNVPRMPSLAELVKARQSPIELLGIDQIGALPRVRTTTVRTAQSARPREVIRLESVEELVERLQDQGAVF